MLKITFEQVDDGHKFAHIESTNGVFGHAAEVKRDIPVGTWLSVPPRYQPTMTEWLCKKCGFEFLFEYPIEGKMHDILIKAY